MTFGRHEPQPAPGDALPRNWVGTARLTSSQPIGVIVTRSTRFGDPFTNYRAFAPNDGARKVLLPVLNKSYGPYQGHRGWDSWFRVLVADGGQEIGPVDDPLSASGPSGPVRSSGRPLHHRWARVDSFAG